MNVALRCLHASFLLACLQASAIAQKESVSPLKTTSQTLVSAPDPVPGLFVDTATKLGLNFVGFAQHTPTKYLIETMGSGVATFDYDNDGLLDIFLVNGASVTDPAPKGTVPRKTSPAEWNRLYHQRKDGTFEDVTEKAGLQGVGYGMGVAVGDYDNDGFEDLFVTSYGGNHLYHNNGNGTFTDVTEPSGTGGPTTPGQTWSTSAAWVDLDNDGLLDLIVLRYVKWDWEDVWCGEYREGYRAFCHPDIFPAISPLVYHNDGKGHFTEVSTRIGLNLPGKGLGIAISRTLIVTARWTLPSRTIRCRSFCITIREAGSSKRRGCLRRLLWMETDEPMLAWESTRRTITTTDCLILSSPTSPIRNMRCTATTVTDLSLTTRTSRR